MFKNALLNSSVSTAKVWFKYRTLRSIFTPLRGSTDKEQPNKLKEEPQKTPETNLQKSQSEGTRLPSIDDPKKFRDTFTYNLHFDPDDMVPRQSDVIIIGGGIMGWSAAYHIKAMANVEVTVVERDPSYTRSSTALGIGGIRQQFSEPENVHMSLVGAEFLRNVREHLCITDEDAPDIKFNPHGFLVTASEAGAEQMEKNFLMQDEMGAKVEMLSPVQLKERWPWMNVDDIACATYGYENEGWFDTWALLAAFRKKAAAQYVNFVQGELIGFEFKNKETLRPREIMEVEVFGTPSHAMVRTSDKNIHPIKFAYLVNAAGPWAGDVAKMAGIGLGGMGGVIPLPVEPRIQHLFSFRPKWKSGTSPTLAPSIDTPWILDYQGTQLKRESLAGDFITWADPPPPLKRAFGSLESESTLTVQDLEVDYQWFYERILPQLKQRIPCLEEATIRSAWAGFYDYNFIDQNLIIGNHPGIPNMFFLNGSSGHGIQHAIAAGKAMAEIIIFGRFKTVDLNRFGFDRFYERIYVKEKEIV